MVHPILLCCIVRDIAEGLSYLHNHSPPIIHCDIRPPNIFLKSLKLNRGEVCAVVGDVGFARIADPKTRTAGSKSMSNDVSGLLHVISLISDKFLTIQNRPPLPYSGEVHCRSERSGRGIGRGRGIGTGNVQQGQQSSREIQSIASSTPQRGVIRGQGVVRGIKREERSDNLGEGKVGGGELISKLRNEVFLKFRQITDMVEKLDFKIDTALIAEMITSDLITPFFEKYNDNCINAASTSDFQRKYEIEDIMNRILIPSPRFNIFQELLNPQQFKPENAEQLLSECLNELTLIVNDQSLFTSNNSDDEEVEYWRSLCRYVIPLLGYAIEQNVFTIQHYNILGELRFDDDNRGDYENGLTLFHYACKSANLNLVDALCPTPSNINNRTYLRSGSAAIHLAISSLKHQSNTIGIEGTMKILDYLLSHGANINLRDNKGETALFKAAMEGSYQLVVHLLNYPQSVDIHILSNEHIPAIIAAARFARGEEGNLCIKALLQMGSEYSPSLRSGGFISNDELNRIRNVANDLILDSTSAFARYPHSTLSIQSWLETIF